MKSNIKSPKIKTEHKVLLMGPPGVGKTRTIQTIIKNINNDKNPICIDFENNTNNLNNWQYHPTHGFDVFQFCIDNVKFSIMDCSGKIVFGRNLEALARGADFAVILTVPGTDITKYINECEKIPFIIVTQDVNVRDGLMKMHNLIINKKIKI